VDRRSWYARSRVVTSLLLAAPEIPPLFMGEEFLEDKNWSDDRSANGLIWWDGLDDPNPAMRDFLRCVTDLVQLRRNQPALRAAGIRVSRVQNYDRIIVLHRWVEWEGHDVIIVASLDEEPKHGYAIGLPFAGAWDELFNPAWPTRRLTPHRTIGSPFCSAKDIGRDRTKSASYSLALFARSIWSANCRSKCGLISLVRAAGFARPRIISACLCGGSVP
jgi:1,4-alpha-glucan branching enzyme